ncbi:MAG: 50S ribosomal protein L19 [Verrucomicrobiota bacterium]|nr:50S ribosomal protein L19 [Verrucomicrobiota bacterium]
MSRIREIEEIEQEYKKKEVPQFAIGDQVIVGTRIVEGDKERVQSFAGVVIAKKGTGLSETFTVYRTAYGSSMERLFLLHSPYVASIEVKRSGKVRRAKLYHLRGKTGKATKLRELFRPQGTPSEEAIRPQGTLSEEATPPSSDAGI